MKKITMLLLVWLVCGLASCYAQASAYAFAQSGGTYTPITGGTVVTSTTDYATSLDGYVSSQLTFSTPFVFAGTSYTKFYVTSNGQLALGTSSPSAYNYTVLSSSTGGNVFIAPFSADLAAGAAGLAEIRWQQVGDEIVVQWKNFRRYGKTESFSFQARLNTVSGTIMFVYDGTPPFAASTDYQPQVGIKSATGIAQALTVDATGSWNTPGVVTSGITSSTIATFNGPVGFTSGLTYTFTPPVSCEAASPGGIAAPLAQSICSGSTPSALTVSGYPMGSAVLSYQWEQSNDNGVTDAWANAVGGTGATTASYTPPSFAGTTIYYRLKISCAGNTYYSTSASVSPPASPATAASDIVFSSQTLTSMTIGWTNGSGNRRYVVVNTTNNFTDPVNGTGPALSAATAYAGGEQIVYDGTGSSVTVSGLVCNTTYYVRVYEYVRCGSSAPYSFYFNTTPQATNPVSQVTSQPATAALPVYNDFTGFTGSNLSTVFPGWYEASGATNPTGTSSVWRSSNAFSVPTAAIELYTDSRNDFIISPKMTINADSRLKFSAAITNYSSSAADPAGMQGTDDKVLVMVSTDGCGAVWTPIYTFNAANTTTLTNVLTDYELPLSAYVGQTIQIAFKGVDGPTNDTPDYDFHIGNIIVENIPSCEAPTDVAVVPTTSGASFSWAASISNPLNGYQWEIRTSGAAGSGATGLAASGTTAAGILTASTAALAASTNYSLYIRSNCGGTDLSPWTLETTFFTAYCTPSSVNATTYIDNFSTTSYFTNITNNTTGYNGTGYIDNYNTHTVSSYAGSSVPFSLGFVGGSLGASIWVDWNNNLEFETSERVFNVGSYTSSTPQTGSIAVPAGTPNGDYRMRVVVDYNATNPSPCFSAANRAEAEDYKFTVISQPTDAVDLGNLEAFIAGVTPAPVTSIQTCQSVTVLAQAFEPGVTEAAGEPAGLTVWIGYSTTNSDPSTWPASAWVAATYNGNVGNNDEYKRTITTLAEGTYYFASRFQLNQGPFMYGAANNGFYNAVTNPNAELTVAPAPAVTASATNTAICAGESSQLSVTTTGTNYTYSWMPGNLTGANPTVTPASTTTYTVTATDAISGCTTTGTVTVNVNAMPTPIVLEPAFSTCPDVITPIDTNGGLIPFVAYCIPAMQDADASGDYIKNFSFADITNNNTDDAEDDYTYYSNLTANVTAGSSYPVSLTAGGATSFYAQQFRIWIDFNHDGIFSANESVFNTTSSTTSATNATGTVTIPASAYNGLTRMRVASKYSSVVGANASCSGESDYGEYEDYNVNITGGVPAITHVWSPVTNLYYDYEATIPYTGQSTTAVFFKSSTAGSTTYTITATTGAGCSVSATTTVTVNTTDAVTASDITLCSGSTVADLSPVATGDNLQWYDVATGGTALASTAVLGGGTYYVSQTQNGCEGPRSSFIVTLNTTAAPATTPAVFCNAAPTVASLETYATGDDLQWYDVETGGTALASTTALVTGTYYVTQTQNGCESARASILVTVNNTAAPEVTDLAFCNAAPTVADIIDATTGTAIKVYDVATGGAELATTTALVPGNYFVSQTVDGCEGPREEITVTLNTTVAPAAPAAQTLCAGLTVADIEVTGTATQWYSSSTGDTPVASTTELTDGMTYYVSQTINGCESTRTAVTVTVNTVDAPTGQPTQTVNEGTAPEATIEDLVITATGTVTWYATEADALAGENALAAGTEITSGDYFAVQTIDGCTSAPFEVMVTVTLGKEDFAIQNVKVYPNPVVDKLVITYSSDITLVEVYNLLGQRVIVEQPNTTTATINMSNLETATYIVKVTADGMTKDVKVVKRN